MDIYVKRNNNGIEATQVECDGYFEHPVTKEQIYISEGDYLVYLELLEDYIVVPKERFESLYRKSIINDMDFSEGYETIPVEEDWSSMMNRKYEENAS